MMALGVIAEAFNLNKQRLKSQVALPFHSHECSTAVNLSIRRFHIF